MSELKDSSTLVGGDSVFQIHHEPIVVISEFLYDSDVDLLYDSNGEAMYALSEV